MLRCAYRPCVQVCRCQAEDCRCFSTSSYPDSCCLRSSVADPLMPQDQLPRTRRGGEGSFLNPPPPTQPVLAQLGLQAWAQVACAHTATWWSQPQHRDMPVPGPGGPGCGSSSGPCPEPSPRGDSGATGLAPPAPVPQPPSPLPHRRRACREEFGTSRTWARGPLALCLRQVSWWEVASFSKPLSSGEACPSSACPLSKRRPAPPPPTPALCQLVPEGRAGTGC